MQNSSYCIAIRLSKTTENHLFSLKLHVVLFPNLVRKFFDI